MVFANKFLETAETRTVDENYTEFSKFMEGILSSKIPTKVSTNRFNLPWFDKRLKRICRIKSRKYKKAKKSGNADHWRQYFSFKKSVEASLRSAKWDYVNGILQSGMEKGDTKQFWKYVKSQKQESFGISALKSNGNVHTDSKTKGEILNTQFQSVFTQPTGEEIPQLPGTPFPPIDDLHISEHGVFLLLDKIDVSKASGPDQIPGRLLQTLAREISPIMHFIFVQTLNTGELPSSWMQANVAPVFKKGSKLEAINYRPVSLTCISCKLFEHILCRHMLNHLEKHNILTDLQHGFRSGRSCETQLITTVEDLSEAHSRNVQIDVAVLDFSKAFDTVPHDALLSKVLHYGINGNIRQWLSNFLKKRKQRVVIDGESSDLVDVVSGVPQGTVLGPILFLLHINDLPSQVSSKVRLFADDCLIYREIKTASDQIKLQEDLNSLEKWGAKWGMRFNAAKCNVMRVSRKRTPLSYFYMLSGEILKEVKDAKYLGVTISDDLDWTKHIQIITSKANGKLAFLRRNLKGCPEKLKEIAYFSLVRSTLEYSSTVWSPHQQFNIKKLEGVQRRAARFVNNSYFNRESVTKMLTKLEWQSLLARRADARLILMYKIINGLAAVPHQFLAPADGRTRANHGKKFKHIRTNSNQYKFSFFPDTIGAWNRLSNDCAEATSLAACKNNLPR